MIGQELLKELKAKQEQIQNALNEETAVLVELTRLMKIQHQIQFHMIKRIDAIDRKLSEQPESDTSDDEAYFSADSSDSFDIEPSQKQKPSY